jgi:uncharacterized membrane protein
MTTIRNPLEWGLDQMRIAASVVGSAGRSIGRTESKLHSPLPAVRRIRPVDLGDVLRQGFDDFAAYRSDVVFLCIVYPVVGLILARAAFGGGLLPMLFPIASGFALVGPFAAAGLYEMSRRREQGRMARWAEAFAVVREPSFGTIAFLGLVLIALYFLWLVTAAAIYDVTLGPVPPASLGSFLGQVFGTAAGWALIVFGVGAGFLFALLVLAIGTVSFPLLLDRDAGLDTAIRTSVRAFTTNPDTMALWGLIVAAALVLGSIPLFVGLIVVMPVLGHATWHLYRKLIP